MSGPLLQVRDLSIRFPANDAPALDQISFHLSVGEAIGILGESGAGKTTLAKAVLRLLPLHARVTGGSVFFEGSDLLKQSEPYLRRIRGARMSLISQEPELALNPVLRISQQVEEVLRAHSRLPVTERRERARAMLAAAGLPEPALQSAYPHQLSGGQRQRAVIAQSLIARPSLLIADEPTSALDTVTQAKIIELLKRLRKELGLALIFITHNPALLGGLVDRVLVMRAGRIVETGSFHQIYWNPHEPYTRDLTTCFAPRLSSPRP